MRWVRYVLDNFSSVKEAVEGIKKIQIVPVTFDDQIFGLHMALEDKSGDSAIVEFEEGELKIYFGEKHRVLTNDSFYPLHLQNLKGYQGFGGDLPIPGGTSSEERFIRTSFYLKHLPAPTSPIDSVNYIFSVIRNVAVPFGAPYTGPDKRQHPYPTWWMSATDMTNRIFYFHWTQSPNMFWVKLDNVDLNENTPIKMLDPKDPTLVNEVSSRFLPVQNP